MSKRQCRLHGRLVDAGCKQLTKQTRLCIVILLIPFGCIGGSRAFTSDSAYSEADSQSLLCIGLRAASGDSFNSSRLQVVSVFLASAWSPDSSIGEGRGEGEEVRGEKAGIPQLS